jgi:flagellar biosynthesis protein FlhF
VAICIKKIKYQTQKIKIMRYKTYRGRTKTEAIAKARIELGNTFYVINEEEKKSGLFGKTKEIEITVGILENSPFVKGSPRDEISSDYTPPKSEAENNTEGDVIVDIKKRDDNFVFENENINIPEITKNSITEKKELSDNNIKGPISFIGIEKFLRRFGDFDDTFIEDFVESLSENKNIPSVKSVEELVSNNAFYDTFKSSLFSYLKKKIYTRGGIKVERGRKKVISFMGPTGVGKTTTLVKLAYSFLAEYGVDTKIVCLDFYRVAAKEQLEMYSDILQNKFEYYSKIEDFRRNFDFENKDVILIDTAGRGQKDYKEILEIKKFLNVIYWDLVKCLVLSATTKYYDLRETVKNFDEEIGVDNIILTKLDETNSLGSCLSLLSQTGKPVTYMTNGQEVPNDIHVADIDSIIKINFDMMLERFKDGF